MDAGADVPALFEVLLTHSMESKGTDWEMLHALLRSGCEEGVLQARRRAGWGGAGLAGGRPNRGKPARHASCPRVQTWHGLTARAAPRSCLLQAAGLEGGARLVLDQLDDLAVDVPKAPLQVRGWLLPCLPACRGPCLWVRRELPQPVDRPCRPLAYPPHPAPLDRWAPSWARWWPRAAPTSRPWPCTSAPRTPTPTRLRCVADCRVQSAAPAQGSICLGRARLAGMRGPPCVCRGLGLSALTPAPLLPPLPPTLAQEGEDTMLVASGGAAKTLGALLQKLAELKGEEGAKEAWAATGEALPAFLATPDREDAAAAQALTDKFGLAGVLA